MQEKFHDKIIPSLLPILDDFQNPRVLTHAGAALVNFCELCPKSVLAGYLDTIIPKLETAFKFGLTEVMCVCVYCVVGVFVSWISFSVLKMNNCLVFEKSLLHVQKLQFSDQRGF